MFLSALCVCLAVAAPLVRLSAPELLLSAGANLAEVVACLLLSALVLEYSASPSLLNSGRE